MFVIIGSLIVFGSTLGGFMLAGGKPVVLLHVSEFVVIGGVALGLVVISTPKEVIIALIGEIKASLTSKGGTKEEFINLMKLLYELFVIGRKDGLIALEEHVTEPGKSAIVSKYPDFLHHEEYVEFLKNAMQPIIDGKIKPEQLETILKAELASKKDQAHHVTGVLSLIGDSLPGVGIVAAVLGIINTMGAISEGPDKVGEKVAAALTGTFLGIFAAYGFINPLNKRLEFMHNTHFMYYDVMVTAIVGFAKGLAPLTAIEIARRGLDHAVQPKSDELENLLKNAGK